MIFIESCDLIKQIEFFKSLKVDQCLYLKGGVLIYMDSSVYILRDPMLNDIDSSVYILRNPMLNDIKNEIVWMQKSLINYKYIKNFITFPIETSSFTELYNDLEQSK